jgi:hypothetical protein
LRGFADGKGMVLGWTLSKPLGRGWGRLPVPIKQRISFGEHAAVLENTEQCDLLHRKIDFLAKGVHTVFGIKEGEADFPGLYFQANL